jgi:thiol-disulfide isomerase/thioredoxin
MRTKRKRAWLVPTLLFGLFLGLLLGGIANGWWDQDSGDVDESPPVIPVTVIPSPQAERGLSRASPAKAPDFVLPDLFDESVKHRLSSYLGRPVIVNFWATWCSPCRAEMPALQRAFEEQRETGLVVLGVNQTFVDNPDAAREFVTELDLTFPNALDDNGNTSEKLYQVLGLPTSIFITAEGEIAHVQIGQMTDIQIATNSRRLIAGETIAQ